MTTLVTGSCGHAVSIDGQREDQPCPSCEVDEIREAGRQKAVGMARAAAAKGKPSAELERVLRALIRSKQPGQYLSANEVSTDLRKAVGNGAGSVFGKLAREHLIKWNGEVEPSTLASTHLANVRRWEVLAA